MYLVCTYYDLKQPFDYSKSSIQGFHYFKKNVYGSCILHISSICLKDEECHIYY